MKIRIRKQIAFISLGVLIIGIVVTLIALSQRQDIRQFAACPAESAVCSWDPVDGAVRYRYTITSSNTVIKEGEVLAPTTRVTFTPIPGTTYTCSVSAVNNCDEAGPEGSATQSCTIADTPTPTPTLTPSPTNVPTVTPITTETPTPPVSTPTDTPIPSSSPTPTTIPTNSPTPQPTDQPTNTPTTAPSLTPTHTPVPTNTPSPTVVISSNPPTSTPTPVVSVAPTSEITPSPTIPPTGSGTFNIGLALGALIAFIGIAVFFAL